MRSDGQRREAVTDTDPPKPTAEGRVAQDPGSVPSRPRVRDRDVVLLAACCVVVVLGLQFLGIVFPPFADALGRPPTMIVALVVVTLAVLGRVLWASVRHG